MFRFEEISYLFLLAIVPVGILLFFLREKWQDKLMSSIGERSLVDRLIPNRDTYRKWLKYIMLLGSILFFLFAGANPQWGTKKEKVKAKSADIFIAFDISQSMMAQDISPSRLERAKRFAERLVESLKGDRIGLIFFAGDAYLQMPLTNDYAAAKLSIRSANTNLAGTQGTAISEAIDLAVKAYELEAKQQRALIIISDGEDHDQDAISAAQNGADDGMVIYTIGVGTEKGAYVPFVENGRAVYKKDQDGNPVLSALNIGNLQEIAKAGGGEFYLVNQGDDALADIKNKLLRLQKRDIEQKSFTEYNSYFQYFLLLGFLLLLIEWILPNSKTTRIIS